MVTKLAHVRLSPPTRRAEAEAIAPQARCVEHDGKWEGRL